MQRLLQLHSRALKIHLEMCGSYRRYLEENESRDRLKEEGYKIRHTNFPEHVSEYMVGFILTGKDYCVRKPKTGDLEVLFDSIWQRVEVKCACRGPTSFGPTEKWEKLYVLEVKGPEYVLHCFDTPYYGINDEETRDECWKNLKISDKHTFQDQAKAGRRPRIQLAKLQSQLESTVIERGAILELLK